MEIIKTVVALCLFTTASPDAPLEHTLMENGFSQCLETKRKAERNSPNVRWVCGEVTGKIGQHSDGRLHLIEIIDDK
jgi:hypothetical protein